MYIAHYKIPKLNAIPCHGNEASNNQKSTDYCQDNRVNEQSAVD